MTDESPPPVALSISEPPAEDLLSRGVSELHVDDLFLELSRHLLSAGLNIAYGRDVRRSGYVERLRNLFRTYQREGVDHGRRLTIFMSKSVVDATSSEALAAIRAVGEIEEVDLAEHVDDIPCDPAVARALELTLMREMMTERMALRIIVGGRVHGAAGRGPGILEEAHLACRDRVPLLVIGGFGGAAGLVARALEGIDDEPPALHESYSEILGALAATEGGGTQDTMLADLRSGGLDLLGNELTDDENEALFETVDVDEITALVLSPITRLGLRHRR